MISRRGFQCRNFCEHINRSGGVRSGLIVRSMKEDSLERENPRAVHFSTSRRFLYPRSFLNFSFLELAHLFSIVVFVVVEVYVGSGIKLVGVYPRSLLVLRSYWLDQSLTTSYSQPHLFDFSVVSNTNEDGE